MSPAKRFQIQDKNIRRRTNAIAARYGINPDDAYQDGWVSVLSAQKRGLTSQQAYRRIWSDSASRARLERRRAEHLPNIARSDAVERTDETETNLMADLRTLSREAQFVAYLILESCGEFGQGRLTDERHGIGEYLRKALKWPVSLIQQTRQELAGLAGAA